MRSRLMISADSRPPRRNENYIHGFPFSAVSMHCNIRGRSSLRYIRSVQERTLYCRQRKWSFPDGKRITASLCPKWPNALIATVSLQKKKQTSLIHSLQEHIPRVSDIRGPVPLPLTSLYIACAGLTGYSRFGPGPVGLRGGKPADKGGE